MFKTNSPLLSKYYIVYKVPFIKADVTINNLLRLVTTITKFYCFIIVSPICKSVQSG